MSVFDTSISVDKSKFNLLEVVRSSFYDKFTTGKLFVNDIFYCYTLEPYFIDYKSEVRENFLLSDIKSIKHCEKVYHNRYVAIPNGVYDLNLNIVSPLYFNRNNWKNFNGGKMPRIMGVPAYDGILIHPGNTFVDTRGCVLVGEYLSKDKLYNSTVAFKNLYNKLISFKYPIKIAMSCV